MALIALCLCAFNRRQRERGKEESWPREKERRKERSSLMKNGEMQGGSPSYFNGLTCITRSVAASQLNSNQWKSLIIPTSCNAVELISVPMVQSYNVNFVC